MNQFDRLVNSLAFALTAQKVLRVWQNLSGKTARLSALNQVDTLRLARKMRFPDEIWSGRKAAERLKQQHSRHNLDSSCAVVSFERRVRKFARRLASRTNKF